MQSKLRVVYGVLSIPRYAVIAGAGAGGLGLLYFFLTMSMLPQHAGTVVAGAGGEASVFGYVGRMAASVGLTAAIAVLGGINIAMVAFKIAGKRKAGAGSNATGILGGALSAFTPGCPACTAPLAVVLGAVGGISILPMQGLDLKLVSVGAMVLAIYWVARGLQRPSCCSV